MEDADRQSLTGSESGGFALAAATNGPTAWTATANGGAGGASGGGRRMAQQRSSLLDDVLGIQASHRTGPVPSTEEIMIAKQKATLVSNVSALITGFTIVALVELNVPDEVPDVLTATYSLLSSALIVIHLFATLVAVCILPSIELMLHQLLEATPDEAHQVREQYRQYRFYVSLAWTCSMAIGVLLFLAELIVIVWVKLSHISFIATATTTALLSFVIVIFLVFGGILHNREGLFLSQLVRNRRERLDQSVSMA